MFFFHNLKPNFCNSKLPDNIGSSNMFYVFLYFSILRDPAADIIVRARERINVWTSPRHHYVPLGLRGCLWIAVNGNYFYSLLRKKPHFQAKISSNQWLLAFSLFFNSG